MPKGCRSLAYEKRCQIEALKKGGLSKGSIARQLGRARSTIHREIGRNTGGRGHRHKRARGRAEARRRAAAPVPWRSTPQRRAEVGEGPREGWSPEQASGRLHLEGRPVGRQRIHSPIQADRKVDGDLRRHPWRRGKNSNRKGGSHVGRSLIPGRAVISERPGIVEEMERIGGGEAGAVAVKAHNGVIVPLANRAAPDYGPSRLYRTVCNKYGVEACRRKGQRHNAPNIKTTKDAEDIIDQEFNDLLDQWWKLADKILPELIERYEIGEMALFEKAVNPAQVNSSRWVYIRDCRLLHAMLGIGDTSTPLA